MIPRCSPSLVIPALAAMLLGACSGRPQGSMAPSTVDPFQGLLARSRDLGPVAGDRQLELLLTLKDASDARRAADLQAMYDPHAPAYLRFKTPDELASEYGPDPDAVARARAALQADGLTTDWSAGDDWLDVTGPAQTVDSTFGVDVRDYVSADGIRFYASIRDPEPPLSLRGIVSSASHISSYAAPARARRVAAVPETGLAPDDLLRAYDIDALRDQGIDGSGETVVVGAPDGGSFLQSDFDEFARQFSDQKLVANVMNLAHESFTALANALYGTQILDPATMYKAFRRDAYEGIHFTRDRFDFDWELVLKLVRRGHLPLEVPVNYRSRSYAEGKKVRFFRDPLTWLETIVASRFEPLSEDQP